MRWGTKSTRSYGEKMMVSSFSRGIRASSLTHYARPCVFLPMSLEVGR
jgi:hypothetical protein